MMKYLNKFYNFIEKIGKRNIMLFLFIFIVFVLAGLYTTFSLYTSTDGITVMDNINTYKFILNAENEVNRVTISADSSKHVAITVTNPEELDLKYGIYYESTSVLVDVDIYSKWDSEHEARGIISSNSNYVVDIKIDNHSNADVSIDFGILFGFENGGDLVLDSSQYWVQRFVANSPNLDDGNLIPVYYDNENENWRKADSHNVDNSWYDYDNKEWANAILISDSTKRTTYQNAEVGTVIPEGDISAFYAWIPRFKYRVWNINRQAGNENTYAYPAYSDGIDIVFEYGVSSTGNVKCNYNVMTVESENNLSDVCVYNNKDTIITNSKNTDYIDAWYTHPAFTFGGVEMTGFWIGKFETSGSASVPKIIPDATALTNQNVSTQFTTSKVFQTYGLSSNIDAHMLTNLEWGAVAYLTHSIYGLCDEDSCRDVYINNSGSLYTGRSSGELSVTPMYTENGYYNYKGYKIDSSGTVSTTEKNISKVASTTGNVTGVYDMSGGAFENVMGNMVDADGSFLPAFSGIDWNGSDVLDSKYYTSYSYGTTNSDQKAFNRARLGDTTAETLGSNENNGVWHPDIGISHTYASFTNNDRPWFERSGFGFVPYSGIFNYSSQNGNSISLYSFRSALT